jgi:hypothetical protein
MAADVSDPFAGLLISDEICRCPICSGQGLAASEPAAAAASSAAAAAWSAKSAPAGVPQLSSRPGAQATLYLDFDGHRESRWGSYTSVVTPAYDTDGNYGSFSAAEAAAIREIWARVAEDYAPFNINVTTVAPPLIANRQAARIVIGGNHSDWFGSSAGGVAYIGGFSNGASNVGYVFEDALGNGNPRFTAEAATHEAGHLFGLAHQAEWEGGQMTTEYNAGNGAWAPIMGVGYYADRTTWSRGATAAGPGAVQDDLAVLAGSTNGFGYAPDDFGSTTAAASALPLSGSNVNVAGLIGTGSDRDVFRFSTGGGSLNLSLSSAGVGANLDGALDLLNAAGQTIASASPAGALGASLARTLAAGTYYVVVRASGGYGNLGRYTLRGGLSGGRASEQPQTPPATPPTSPLPAAPASKAIRIIDNGAAGFATSGTWQRATGVGSSGDIAWTAAGKSGAEASWTFTGLAAGQYRIAASWPGSKLYSSHAPFSVHSGGRLLGTVRVNQERAARTFTASDTRWQNLGTFTVSGNSLTVRLAADSEGRVIADAIRLERVFATSGGTLARAGELLLAEPPEPQIDEAAGETLLPDEIDNAIFPQWEGAHRREALALHRQFAAGLATDDATFESNGDADELLTELALDQAAVL